MPVRIATLFLLFSLTAPALSHPTENGDDHDAPSFPFGDRAPDAEPDRVVRIKAEDSMTFEPASITVQAGETVRFDVTNTGRIAHAFSLDTLDGQVRHENEMTSVPMDAMMSHMEDEPNGFVLKPGETQGLTWTFTGGGPVQFACHIPGHYPAGMHGLITISGGDAADAPRKDGQSDGHEDHHESWDDADDDHDRAHGGGRSLR